MHPYAPLKFDTSSTRKSYYAIAKSSVSETQDSMLHWCNSSVLNFERRADRFLLDHSSYFCLSMYAAVCTSCSLRNYSHLLLQLQISFQLRRVQLWQFMRGHQIRFAHRICHFRTNLGPTQHGWLHRHGRSHGAPT